MPPAACPPVGTLLCGQPVTWRDSSPAPGGHSHWSPWLRCRQSCWFPGSEFGAQEGFPVPSAGPWWGHLDRLEPFCCHLHYLCGHPTSARLTTVSLPSSREGGHSITHFPLVALSPPFTQGWGAATESLELSHGLVRDPPPWSLSPEKSRLLALQGSCSLPLTSRCPVSPPCRALAASDRALPLHSAPAPPPPPRLSQCLNRRFRSLRGPSAPPARVLFHGFSLRDLNMSKGLGRLGPGLPPGPSQEEDAEWKRARVPFL